MARRPILENAVMDVLWDHGGWVGPSQIRDALNRDIAPTTVGTVLARLHDKGRIERRKRGKAYEYRAVTGREEHVASRMEEALETSRDRPLALLEFVDRLPVEDRHRLRRILDR